MRTRRFLKSLFALSLVAPVLWANAQTYPARPLTIVVPFPAGGALDTVARVIAEQMRADLGQPVVVDNRAGAGGTIGSALVARAAPDGYTILLGSPVSMRSWPTIRSMTSHRSRSSPAARWC